MQTQPTKTNAPNYRIPPRTPLPSHLPLIFGVLGVLSWRITRTFFLEFMTPRFRNLLPGEMLAPYQIFATEGFHRGRARRPCTVWEILKARGEGCFRVLTHATNAGKLLPLQSTRDISAGELAPPPPPRNLLTAAVLILLALLLAVRHFRCCH